MRNRRRGKASETPLTIGVLKPFHVNNIPQNIPQCVIVAATHPVKHHLCTALSFVTEVETPVIGLVYTYQILR